MDSLYYNLINIVNISNLSADLRDVLILTQNKQIFYIFILF